MTVGDENLTDSCTEVVNLSVGSAEEENLFVVSHPKMVLLVISAEEVLPSTFLLRKRHFSTTCFDCRKLNIPVVSVKGTKSFSVTFNQFLDLIYLKREQN